MWHPEVLSEAARRALRDLTVQPAAEGFYLGGGTGLAPWLGHRRSEGLDLFRPELFDEDLLVQQARQFPGFELVAKSAHTVHAKVDGVRVSFLSFAYPVLFPFARFEGIDVADPRDIGCMKISAIASRGIKRDFVDLYFTARQYGLPHLLELFRRKYSLVRYNNVHILKSLVYFQDADREPMPGMLAAVEWAEVKDYFIREVAGRI